MVPTSPKHLRGRPELLAPSVKLMLTVGILPEQLLNPAQPAAIILHLRHRFWFRCAVWLGTSKGCQAERTLPLPMGQPGSPCSPEQQPGNDKQIADPKFKVICIHLHSAYNTSTQSSHSGVIYSFGHVRLLFWASPSLPLLALPQKALSSP